MKIKVSILLLLILPCLTVFSEEEALTAREIVKRCDELLRGEESYATMTMTITRPRWKRSVTMEAWTRGTEDSFIRILSPRKEKGVTFLKKGREAWNYVPAIDRAVKLPPSMMLQSWMGSDFTNDDVVRADSIVTDYTHEIAGQPEENGIKYWLIDVVPKKDAAVVWGRVRFKVRKETFVADRVDYFDEDNELVRYYVCSEIEKIQGRHVATKLIAYDVTEDGHSTTIKYDKLTFDPKMTKDTFSVKNLRR